VIVDFEVDPRVPIILRRPFLRTTKALVDLYKEKLTLRVENEQVVFYTDKSSRNNSRDIQSEVHFLVLHLSRLSDSLLEKFADELALLDPFPPRNEDDNFDPEADLKEIEYLLNQDPFTDEPSLVYSSPPGDDDDDLFDLKSDNEEWKKLLYGDLFDNTHSENEKDKDLKIESLIDDMDDDLFDLKSDNEEWKKLFDSTLLEESSESSEITTLLSSPFGNEDKVFNPGILILGGTQIFYDESKDKYFKVNTSSEALLILEEHNFLSISSDQELLFHLEISVTETLLKFSSENEDKVFNPGIPISKGVYSFTLGLSHRSYETFKIVNVHPNILNEGPMQIFLFFCLCP
ncbi:hypothetical protein Tco_1100912, partial [Tanacetum coccineum]